MGVGSAAPGRLFTPYTPPPTPTPPVPQCKPFPDRHKRVHLRRRRIRPAEGEEDLERGRAGAVVELEAERVHAVEVPRLFDREGAASVAGRMCMSRSLVWTLKYSPNVLKFPNVPNASSVTAPLVTITCTRPSGSSARSSSSHRDDVELGHPAGGQARMTCSSGTPSSRASCTVILPRVALERGDDLGTPRVRRRRRAVVGKRRRAAAAAHIRHGSSNAGVGGLSGLVPAMRSATR